MKRRDYEAFGSSLGELFTAIANRDKAVYANGFAAGLEQAAKITEAYDGDGLRSTGYGDQTGNAEKTMKDIAAAIRAEKESAECT